MKRTWAIGVFTILLVIFLTGHNILQQRQAVLQEAHSNASNLLNAVESDLETTFTDIEQALSDLEYYLTTHPGSEHVGSPEIRSVIDNLVLNTPPVKVMAVISHDGQVLYWNSNSNKPNVSHRAYFQIHQTGNQEGLFIGLPQQSIVNKGEWIFGISKAVRKEDGSLSMVEVAIINLFNFSHQYDSRATYPGLELRITSPEGYVYAQVPYREKALGEQVTGFDKEDGQISSATELIELSTRLAGHPMIVTVTREKSAILAPWRQTAISFTIVGLAICFILMYLTYRMALYQQRQNRHDSSLYAGKTIDPLTELLTYSKALELAKLEVKKAQRSNTPLSLIMLDLDQLKNINLNYGHFNGDKALNETAALLKLHSRETDVICREGGGRFLLILPDTPLKGAVSNAQKICSSLATHEIPHASGTFSITASFGVAQWTTEEADLSEAIKRAEDALSTVKAQGCNDVRWKPAHSDQKGISDIDLLLNS